MKSSILRRRHAHAASWAAVSCLAFAAITACTPNPVEPAPAHRATFSNPIVAGFSPDPSICRVGDDFYLVTSTFEYFPGLPIYHSRDLVNWSLIGHALADPGQVDLASVDSSGGIHAATIRHSAGTFYVVTTNIVGDRPVSFIVTARDPRGPWSAPHVLQDAPGIDPSLFFDDDGRVWYTANHVPPDPEFPGQAEIWLQELDLAGMQLVGERHFLWRGCCGGTWAEGPHIYKKDGFYYLLISEGGTAYEHALAVAIGKDITGPYRNNPRNPVLTHRHLGYDYPITGVGHADLVELADGRWYAVALGWRLIDGVHGTLGRETFLVPVEWETERYWWKEEKYSFPVFSRATGKVELRYPLPFPGAPRRPLAGFADDFGAETLLPEWNFRRAPAEPFHSLSEAPGSLRIALQPGRLGVENGQYSFVGVRQRDFEIEAVTRLAFAPRSQHEEAGLVVVQNDRSAFLLTLTDRRVRLAQTLYGETSIIAETAYEAGEVFLRVVGDYLEYAFYASPDGVSWTAVGDPVNGVDLSSTSLRGFNYTGVYVGLYASSNGAPTTNHADFASFELTSRSAAADAWFDRQLERGGL